MHLLYTSNNFWKAPMEVLLCEHVNDLRHSLFHLLNCLITTDSELREKAKVTGSKFSTIGRVRNCLDAYLDPIVCDKDGVVDWCHWPYFKSAGLFRRKLFLNSLKPQHSIPCWLPVQWEPSACRSCCQKKDHQKFVGGFALSGLLGSGRASMLPLGTMSLGLWVIAVDLAFIAGHQSIKNCEIWIDQLDHLPAVMTTSFFLIFSEHPWDKLRANLPYLQFLVNNCVYSFHTDIKLCTYWSYRHSTVLIHEILYLPKQLWCSDFLTPPRLSSSLTDSLSSLNLLRHSKTDARFMQDAPKAVWSIPYFSGAFFFSSLKQNFIAYRSSKISSRQDWIFEIHQLWQSGFSRVYSNCSCSCSFEAEIIKIGQSSHKMYSNNILNFQDNFKYLYKNSLETYWRHEYIYIYI